MIPSGASYSAPLLTLTLTDMSFHQSPGNDLFIWGNSLFYSPDGGATMLVVYILTAPATITYFTSSPDGTFAFLTSDNQEFFGNLGTKSIFPITTTRTPSAGSVYFPYFDRSNTFKELTLTQTGNTFTTSSTTLDVSSVLDYNQLKTSATCPYSRMLFVYTSDAVTVQNQDSGLLVSESLPNSIYLDYKKSYTFSVRMTPTTPASSGTLQLGFYLSNNDAIGISWTRNVVANWEIQYDITLTDLGAQGQTYPGTNLKGTALRITPIGSNFGCKNFVGRSWKTKVTQSIVVYSGCPPNQAMKFDWSSSTATQSCPNANSSLPCLFYDEVFPLKFSILNQITNTLSQYTGTYTLQVIGGGPSLTTISNYTNTQITSVNPGGNTLIWSDSSANQIT
ncbi:hypothetical protein BCR33DRAFT_740348 [Rhizoclosmatium globosum]|uniref:Uncharacterized protein n=1 Tax=Rhizoclosmatium globosum TaxID=329046 RepID=A0A1Y2C0F9_9FUNG|nr:hypothetical protein BCR33DRAFT_740348 [Rhizoclosmatium globosum]|eukprot:ORY40518.1 hypothetical protein BCR33DRAFT_740348 [Rhizoclosmatium globosum]